MASPQEMCIRDRIRKEKNVPILLLSAKTEDADKIAGRAIGADDYITKPCLLYTSRGV